MKITDLALVLQDIQKGATKIPVQALVLQDIQKEEPANPAKGLWQVAQLPIVEEHQLHPTPFLRLLEHPHYLPSTDMPSSSEKHPHLKPCGAWPPPFQFPLVYAP
jgi:hypothetical protein